MTILDFNTGAPVIGVLLRGERGRMHQLALRRLSPADTAAIRSALDTRISGSRIETSAWIPGSDWRGTPYQAIFEDAAEGNPEVAAMMFGLFVWEAFERHEADWYTERFSMGADEDRFRVYFRPDS